MKRTLHTVNTENTSQIAPARPHLIRRLYNWTIGWADRPGGAWALFCIAFAEASFFPIPPDVLLVALCVGASRKSLRFALICSVGSVLGGMFGYLIGYGAWHVVKDLFIPYVFSQALFDKVQGLYQQNAFVALLAAAFTPIPYKVFTVAAGVFGVDFLTLVGTSLMGRSARFFLVGGVLFFFGPTMKALLEKYFDWFAWALLALGIGGFLALRYLR
ncbi:MAG: DedA family protein [Verrucomicrobia bacterium]|nr:DedA family protein [Verrucomicrobiota bacterium]